MTLSDENHNTPEGGGKGLRVVLAGRCPACIGGTLLIDRADSGWGGVQRAVCLNCGRDNLRRSGPPPKIHHPRGSQEDAIAWGSVLAQAMRDLGIIAALGGEGPAVERYIKTGKAPEPDGIHSVPPPSEIPGWLTEATPDLSAPLYAEELTAAAWGRPGRRAEREMAAGQLTLG